MIGTREQWTTRVAFILAASGSAVGLGNIWRFSYVTGTNGGAAFLLGVDQREPLEADLIRPLEP